MDFFEKLSDTAIAIGKEVSDRAKDVSSCAMLQYDIRSREGYLNELYQDLGKKYYEDHKDDEDADFTEIDGLIKELDEMRRELMEKKGADKCPKCGNYVAKDADYCSKCGKQLKGVDVEADEEE
ncbi:MAG: zinc-ribbon domain-containing protein [Lachnospiraceae bacterium]|nr:zinc-ribbon domain-containing protein [Lachnospiraceae bacterium]